MERKDFLRQGGPCFYFDTELFAPTTDSFALGWFAAPKRGERVCDLGSGTGLLGTLLLAREPSLTLFCVEQNATANALAEKGFEIDKKKIQMNTVKTLGTFDAEIRLMENISVKIKVTVAAI